MRKFAEFAHLSCAHNIYQYEHVCTWMYTYIHHMYTTCMGANVHIIYMNICKCVYIYTYVYNSTCANAHIYIYIYICMYKNIQTCA